MSLNQRLALLGLTILLSSTSVSAGAPPGPADDEILTGSFEGIGYARFSVKNFGIAVPSDGLPVLLQDDVDAYYLAKCRRLDCATGTDREFIAETDNRHRAALTLGSDGFPILAYWDKEFGALRFEHCSDASCTNRNTETLTVGDTSNVSVAVGADGFPMLVYYLDRSIRYLKCNDLFCEDTEAEITLDSTGAEHKISISVNDQDLPIIAYANFERVGSNNVYTMVVTTCDSENCSGNLERHIVDTGPLFQESLPVAETLSVVVPPGAFPMLFANAALAGNDTSRIIAVACQSHNCDKVSDPEIISLESILYPSDLDATVSADGLPMLSVNGSGVSGVEFIQCQTVDCGGEVTNRVMPRTLVGEGQFPKISVAADGNPIMTFFRGQNISGNTFAGVAYCRDPECESFGHY